LGPFQHPLNQVELRFRENNSRVIPQ